MNNNSPLSDDDCNIFTAVNQLYCYVPITKVASSFLRQALPGRQFNIHQWCWYDQVGPAPNEKSLKYLVVLRDPVQRWISGAVEFWCRYFPPRDWLGNIDDVFETIEFDVHTRPQIDFLHAVDYNRTTWLWMDAAVEHHPWFVENNVNLRSVPITNRNLGNSRPIIYQDSGGNRSDTWMQHSMASTPSALIQQCLTDRLAQDTKSVERIKRYYCKDYDLIASINHSRGFAKLDKGIGF